MLLQATSMRRNRKITPVMDLQNPDIQGPIGKQHFCIQNDIIHDPLPSPKFSPFVEHNPAVILKIHSTKNLITK